MLWRARIVAWVREQQALGGGAGGCAGAVDSGDAAGVGCMWRNHGGRPTRKWPNRRCPIQIVTAGTRSRWCAGASLCGCVRGDRATRIARRGDAALVESGVTWLGPTIAGVCAVCGDDMCAKASTGCTAWRRRRWSMRCAVKATCLSFGRSGLSAPRCCTSMARPSSLHKRPEQRDGSRPVAGCTQTEWSLSPSELALFWRAIALVGRRALSPPPAITCRASCVGKADSTSEASD